MRCSSPGRGTALVVLLCLGGCGRGPLPDLGFGSAGRDTGTGGTSADADDGPDGGPSSSSSPGTSSGWGESVGDDADSDSDDDPSSSSNDDADTASTTRPSTSNSDDADSAEWGDGDADSAEWGDEWGIPPDVTNEPCEPLAQDCFPTHKCVPFATQPGSTFLDADKCMPILGDKQWGEPCTLSNFNEAQDDCDADGFCWNLQWIQGQMHGTCVPFCLGSPQSLMCPLGWGCLFTGAVALCARQCDPLLQDCPGGFGCYWAASWFDCMITGTPAGPGQACVDSNDCNPGLACVGKNLVPGCQGNDPNCCTPWCDLDEPDTCAGPLSCVAFFDPDEAPAMLADVGICVLP